MKIRCLIIDDEPLATNVIKKYLKEFNQFEIAGVCHSAIEAFNLLKNKSPQVVFLDINMPNMSGIDLIKTLEHPPLIVITTAYRDYAVEGFEYNVFDYLVKPIAFPRFMKTIDRLTERLLEKPVKGAGNSSKEEDFIFVKVDKKMVKIMFADILYIESLKDYVRIKTVYEDFITHHTLAGITVSLPPEQFMRIHRSYTIALAQVKALDGNSVEIGGKSLPVGRNYRVELKKVIQSKSLDQVK